MSHPPLLTIYTDGASRGNPGDAAYAYVIEGAGPEPIEEAGCLGKMTNNQAEYIALVRALQHAKKLGTNHRLLVHSDSELMVKQMKGEYRVKNEDLLDLYEEAKELADAFTGGVNLVHVRRAKNKRADQLCNEALDGKRESSGEHETKGKPKKARPEPTEHAPAKEAGHHKSQPAAGPSVSDEALACLREAESAWRKGEEAPSVETVWRWLVEILARHGVQSTALTRDRAKP